jgi:hypothetical protein
MLESNSWHSYPKVYALGHSAINELLYDDVICEEKCDGSQFSFGVIDGQLRVRSHNKEMIVDAPEKMFQQAVDTVKELPLHDGWTYRAEYLSKPKHNALNYGRIPNKHLIIFDINTGMETYLSYAEKKNEADRLGLETVPLLFQGKITELNVIAEFLDTDSVLGNVKIEGVVIKNYLRFGKDGKVLMGKYVSEKYKEIQSKEWKAGNPNTKDVVQMIIASLRTDARWEKAVQHLKETDEYCGSPVDIGNLLKEIHKDIEEECEEYIKDKLYSHFLQQIKRGVCAGFPEWYKNKLMESQPINEN